MEFGRGDEFGAHPALAWLYEEVVERDVPGR